MEAGRQSEVLFPCCALRQSFPLAQRSPHGLKLPEHGALEICQSLPL